MPPTQRTETPDVLDKTPATSAPPSTVNRAATLLRDEIDRDLVLLGIRSVSEITPDLVRKF
jgi:L-lactate dehydrogenase (cytochrome)